jgi:hypothetical protein
MNIYKREMRLARLKHKNVIEGLMIRQYENKSIHILIQTGATE